MYPNQMVPLFEIFVQKRTCCHKLYAKKWKKLTILKNCILRHIYIIQNSSSRWDATAKLYFCLLFYLHIWQPMYTCLTRYNCTHHDRETSVITVLGHGITPTIPYLRDIYELIIPPKLKALALALSCVLGLQTN